MDRDFCTAFLFITCIKFLFIPMYHSTDMEVHRNWKAITHSLSLKQWYYEDTSPWTLDYPPFFAWFECGLSYIAKAFDSKLLDITNLNYDSREALFFMRLTVILSDLLYVFAIGKIYSLLKQKNDNCSDPWVKPEVVFAMLMLWNPGLLIVDHIHFQYNGFLNGLLFLSIVAIMEDKYLEGAVWYCILLNFKHIYLYLAPAYFVYLLRHYCFNQRRSKGGVKWINFSARNFFKLSTTVIVIFVMSFGPFIASGQVNQVLKQMFPINRGLTHAYWAPNVWALYNFIDRILVAVAKLIYGPKGYGSSSVTKGLVQQYDHIILPTIGAKFTVLITLLSVLPFMWILWNKPKSSSLFVQAIVGCAFGSFLFGYHVHEKAILMTILPLTLLAVCDSTFVNCFLLVSMVGHFSLFPLLHESGETPIKIVMLIMHVIYSHVSLKRLHKQYKEDNLTLFSVLEMIVTFGLLFVQGLNSFGGTIDVKLNTYVKYPFFPLMITSVFCAISIIYCWVTYCKLVFRN